MAAKALDSGNIKKEELNDMTTCCICSEVYTDPKVLPCIHTFCMKCIQESGLKTDKGPGDEMPCPICRRMFKIPTDGFHQLPKNFFIERLIQMANVSHSSQALRALCDACLEDENEETGKEIPAADKYCVNCKHKLCEECCSEHRTFKLTKNHKLIPINDHEGGQNVMIDLASSVCELHEENVLNVYCADCKTVVCAICFIDDHKNHEGSHVKKFVDDFRRQIESNAEAMNECRSKAEMTKTEILKVKEDIQKRVENLECNVEKRKNELKLLADKHAASLLQSLFSIRQSKLKEIQMTTDDIDAYLSCLETYNSYCEKIIAKGSASDICRAFSDLSIKAMELKEHCQPMIEREIQSFNLSFRKFELEQFLEESCDNILGEFEEEGDSKPTKRSKESLLVEQSNEIDILRKEIEIERTEKESLRLSNEQLRVSINMEIQSNRALKDELDKEKANYDSLQTNIDQLKQELNKEKIANSSVQADKDKLKHDLDKEKLTNNLLHASNRKLVKEVNMYKTKLRKLEDNVVKLKQELETTKTGSRNKILELEEKLNQEHSEKEQLMIVQTEEKRKLHDKLRYTRDPVLVQTIRTKAAEEGNSISGLTILDKELFVVSAARSQVEVYDSIKFSLKRRWNLKGLISPGDIVSCKKNKCIYIFDFKGYGQSSEILRVDPNGNLLKNWSAGDDWGEGLSVTDELNVILTSYEKNKINEYSPDGQLVREVVLSSDVGIRHPRHAIKLSNGHFVVSHGLSDGDLHRVCAVDADGKLKKSFGGRCGSNIGQMNSPVHMSIDRNGFVMVADQMNSRVLLLDQNLEFKREILSKGEKHGLRNPFTILLDESNGRVFVTDYGWDSEQKTFIDGRILIFDFE